MSSVPIYSRFLAGEHAFTGTAVIAVPAGDVVIVRDIDVVVGVSAGITFIAYSAGNIAFAANSFGVVTAPKAWWGWRGRQVLEGPTEAAFNLTGEGDFRVSGYLLRSS